MGLVFKISQILILIFIDLTKKELKKTKIWINTSRNKT